MGRRRVLENPQQFRRIGGFSFEHYLGQFDNGSSATNAPSAATTTRLFPSSPRRHRETSYDTQFREHPFHFEVAGLLRSLRVLNTLATPSRTDTIIVWGLINLNFQLIKNLTFRC